MQTVDTPRDYLTGPYLEALADNHKFRQFKTHVLLPMEEAARMSDKKIFDYPSKFFTINDVDQTYAIEQLRRRLFRVYVSRHGITVITQNAPSSPVSVKEVSD